MTEHLPERRDRRRVPAVLRAALALVGVPLLGLAALLAWPPAPAGVLGAVGGFLLGACGAVFVGAALRGRSPAWLPVTEPVVWPEAIGSAALGMLFAGRRDIAAVLGARTPLSEGAARWLVVVAAGVLLLGLVCRRSVVSEGADHA